MHRAAFERVGHADFLHQMLYLDTKIFMATLNLTYNDKMSMASSVEVRVPFLDRELAGICCVEYPASAKAEGRPAANNQVHLSPSHARHSAPRGSPATEGRFRSSCGTIGLPMIFARWWTTCSPRLGAKRGMFRPEAVRRFVDEHRSGRQDWSMQLWQFVTLELWMQTFLDGGDRKFESGVQPKQVATS